MNHGLFMFPTHDAIEPASLTRLAEEAGGWCPLPEPALTERIVELQARASDAGREVSVSVLGLAPDREALDEHEQAGADRAVFAIRPGPRDDVQQQLDAILAAVG